ncbi:hypothetical protein KIKIMORA_03130 [Brevundimonas phage vB_BpoS-Kikimora]|uniref:Uncharacterized protein n=1 Tax=Brevundimonas phage vB_BpoS-Kikimora TaxID=2948601 RepID=A0A9E7MSV3_9CAUD|nr:hypothetical protein KIKIMORA_03130 [Brevundimonas phage vB_BpoS-Kikimora]
MMSHCRYETTGALWHGWPPYLGGGGYPNIGGGAPWVQPPLTLKDTTSVAQPAVTTVVISVYLDNGVVFEYDVVAGEKVREHVSAIVSTGYRSVRDGVLTHYPPHRILKVCASGQTSAYPDRVRGA